jgi:HisJ family histidinol phosphate phosphatase
MRYVADHDFHIHSYLSSCSRDPEQTAERILTYAEENGLKNICLTDHLWDSSVVGASKWYTPQNIEHISEILPLPYRDNVNFHFGCETELDKHLTLGLAKENFDKFDFIIIPTTHLHMTNFTIDEDQLNREGRVSAYVNRLRSVLAMDLPFHKIGIAHLTCPLIARESWQEHIAIIDSISDEIFGELFSIAAKKGVGIELNFPIRKYEGDELDSILRPYRIAKANGCKFYFGSDAHHPSELAGAKQRFEQIIDALELTEDDRFRPFG